jgi:hypothetical protein
MTDADQAVWNHGAPAARAFAATFREVGAVENADLFDRLAGELDAIVASGDDVVARFLAFRHRVGGPFFAVPDLGEELAEALVEYAVARAAEFPQ